jgi:hypothetical protein
MASSSLCGYRLILLTTGLLVFALLFDRGLCGTDVVHTLDKTGGGGNGAEERFNASKASLVGVISSPSGTDSRIGVVEFGETDTSVTIMLGSWSNTLSIDVGSIIFETGSTTANFNAALQLAVVELSRGSGRKRRSANHGRPTACTRGKAVTLFTSSVDVAYTRNNWSPAVATAKAMSDDGINVIAVGIGPRVDQQFLLSLAGESQHVYIVENAAELISDSTRLNRLVRAVANDIIDTVGAIITAAVPTLSTTAKIIIGVLAGILGLLVVVLIVVICCLIKKKNYGNEGGPNKVADVKESNSGPGDRVFARRPPMHNVYGHRSMHYNYY